MNKEALDRAIKSLAIQEVYILESNFGFHPKYEPFLKDCELSSQARFGLKKFEISTERDGSDETHYLSVHTETAIRMIDEECRDKELYNDEGIVVAFSLTTVFVSVYIVTSQIPEHDALVEFSKNNALFHIWPYWREYAQSVCARSGLPRFTLPMFRIPK